MVPMIGIVRKQLGLTFLGETRSDQFIVTGDIRLKCPFLDREVCPFFIQRKQPPNPVSKYFYRFGSFDTQKYALFLPVEMYIHARTAFHCVQQTKLEKMAGNFSSSVAK
jgi:hypothetical protein